MTMTEQEAWEWLVCIPWLGGREPARCPVCKKELLTPDDIKQCRFGYTPDIVHKTCWNAYEAQMSDRKNNRQLVDWPDFGERVMLARRRLRYSQTEMAERCGISRNYLSQIERGIADPSYTIIVTLCRH